MYNKRLLIVFLSCAALMGGVNGAHAEIFKSIDKDGNVTFSDKASKSSKKVKLKEANSLPAVKIPPKLAAEENSEESGEESSIDYKYIRIVTPSDDSSVAHGAGDISITTRSKPKLMPGHKVQLLLDGVRKGAAFTDGTIQLRNIDRGTHSLQVQIIDQESRAIKTSKTINVHVFRPSVLSPSYNH